MIACRRIACIALAFAVWSAPLASAQSSRPAPPSEVISLQTRDGVQLKATYYPSSLRGTPRGKQVTPVVMLHDYKNTRAIFASLAQQLQSPVEGHADRPSFAVITVDLRAHGDSTKQITPDGFTFELDAAKLDRAGLLAMAMLDMEAVRSFLVAKNDAGELNLNKLCLVGAGMGANVAANWAAQDWAAPALAIGKQGQDVKGLVLVSPRWSYKGLSMQGPMRFRPLMQNAAWLLIYGEEDPKVKTDVRRITNQLERFHPEPADADAGPPRRLSLVAWPSKLQGDTLLNRVGQPLEDPLTNFLVEHVAQTEYPWLSRLNRLPSR
jgi:pimeloyl-ACP methyl ester carboxylesterase